MSVHMPQELITDANIALQLLKDGNERYITSHIEQKEDFVKTRALLANGQKPFAVVLCCSDSRVSPEIFFDQDLGDIFVIRNAGNIVDPTTLGSLEYAVEHLGAPLVVVCGHSKCGAVTAACNGGDLPTNIKYITDRIQPAKEMGGDIDVVIHNNVNVMVNQIKDDEFVKLLHVKVVGAYYDIETGQVEWLED